MDGTWCGGSRLCLHNKLAPTVPAGLFLCNHRQFNLLLGWCALESREGDDRSTGRAYNSAVANSVSLGASIEALIERLRFSRGHQKVQHLGSLSLLSHRD